VNPASGRVSSGIVDGADDVCEDMNAGI